LGRRVGASEEHGVDVSRVYGPGLLLVAILIMGLAIYAVPYPGNLLLLSAGALGAVIAAAMILRRTRAHE
jgi:hypothetical protein